MTGLRGEREERKRENDDVAGLLLERARRGDGSLLVTELAK